MDSNIRETASIFIEVTNDIYMPEQTDRDQNTSTDDDIPLSSYKDKRLLHIADHSSHDFKKRKKLSRAKNHNRKIYEYKNGKKVFRQSGCFLINMFLKHSI